MNERRTASAPRASHPDLWIIGEIERKTEATTASFCQVLMMMMVPRSSIAVYEIF